MPINSREKGKRGELQVVHILRELGIRAERSAQRSGKTGLADVVLKDYPTFHLEVKWHKKFWGKPAKDAMEQAEKDKRAYALPVVVGRGDNEAWHAMIPFEVLVYLIRKAEGEK